MLENIYIVNYSRLQCLFYLVKGSNRHIVRACNNFTGIYKAVNALKKDNNIEIIFTDSAIDEISRRNLCEVL